MIAADDFLGSARDQGFSFYTGVPCSFLTPLINRVISDRRLDYVGATSEGEAVAIAAGAWLAGRRTVVMCQNSGLGNAVNPLTSLNFPFRIPTLLIVTWRGQPGLHDEPQHVLMGEITAKLLETLRIPHADFPSSLEDVAPMLAKVVAQTTDSELPFGLVMARGSVRDDALQQESLSPRANGRREDLRRRGDRPARIAVLERTLALAPEAAGIVATTGKTGRELFTLADREQHLYLVGSMGCASGLALGVALNSRRKIIVLDGDGAALMKLGTLATVGACAPGNLVHVILDNGVHDSTGGQATVSPVVDFGDAALACGYARAYRCDSVDGFDQAFQGALDQADGPALIHIGIRPGSIEKLGRPTVTPYEVARRFKAFLAADEDSQLVREPAALEKTA
jgi:phosphonopyruvate decarboxylase